MEVNKTESHWDFRGFMLEAGEFFLDSILKKAAKLVSKADGINILLEPDPSCIPCSSWQHHAVLQALHSPGSKVGAAGAEGAEEWPWRGRWPVPVPCPATAQQQGRRWAPADAGTAPQSPPSLFVSFDLLSSSPFFLFPVFSPVH